MTLRYPILIAGLLALLPLLQEAHAGWKDYLKPLEGAIGNKTLQHAAGSALSGEEMTRGLKEALSVGVKKAIEYLGKDGGFLNDRQVRIPLPGALQKIEKGLRAMGQGKVADEFVATLNHAAEKAVPKTASIIADSIKKMSIKDAQKILNGPDDAATRYFRDTNDKQLTAAIMPIVREATAKTGVTSAYKNLIGQAGFMAKFMNTDNLDLDKYVTRKTLDGLFLKLAQEEKQIRTNPVARSTELLKKVFGGSGG